MTRQKKNEKKSKPALVIRDQELGQQEQSGVKGGSTNSGSIVHSDFNYKEGTTRKIKP